MVRRIQRSRERGGRDDEEYEDMINHNFDYIMRHIFGVIAGAAGPGLRAGAGSSGIGEAKPPVQVIDGIPFNSRLRT